MAAASPAPAGGAVEEAAEDAFLEEWAGAAPEDELAAAHAATEEDQFRAAMGMLDQLLDASATYHERMSAINEDVIAQQEPTGLVGTLRGYQSEGFRWLVARFLFGEGAILVRGAGAISAPWRPSLREPRLAPRALCRLTRWAWGRPFR